MWPAGLQVKAAKQQWTVQHQLYNAKLRMNKLILLLVHFCCKCKRMLKIILFLLSLLVPYASSRGINHKWITAAQNGQTTNVVRKRIRFVCMFCLISGALMSFEIRGRNNKQENEEVFKCLFFVNYKMSLKSRRRNIGFLEKILI